jgi:hypothetical protein
MGITLKILIAIILFIISVTLYLVLLVFFDKTDSESTDQCPKPDVGWVQFGRIIALSTAITSLCVIIYLGVLFAGKTYIKVETAGLIG